LTGQDEQNHENCEKVEFGSISVNLSYSEINERLTSSSDVKSHYSYLKEKPKEYFYAVFLRADNSVIGDKLIGAGDPSNVATDVGDIVRTASVTNARAVILVHNHPSQTSGATEADVEVTKEIEEVLQLIGVDLLDHLIIAEPVYSMKEHGDI
jgi:DNA repair protein RadC